MSITMIGLDTAKSVFQVHGVNETGKVEIRRKLRRSELIPFFEKQEACTVVVEACGAAHHWARILSQVGHEVKLIAPEAVRPFVKKGKKNDPADAAALCEAASRPDMMFVPVKNSSSKGPWPCIRPGPYWSSSRRCWRTPCAAWRRNLV
jgi:error-prone DNA polymerase